MPPGKTVFGRMSPSGTAPNALMSAIRLLGEIDPVAVHDVVPRIAVRAVLAAVAELGDDDRPLDVGQRPSQTRSDPTPSVDQLIDARVDSGLVIASHTF